MSESTGVAITVRTVETRFVNADASQQAADTFTRIIALETSDSLTTCAGLEEIADSASRLELRFSDQAQADRFIRYFTEVIAKHDTAVPGNTDRVSSDYNCKTFARAMATGEDMFAGTISGYRWLAEEVELRPAAPPFAIGKLACLGVYDHTTGTYLTRHCVIGQGEDSDMCLSVLDNGGPLVFAPYDALQRHYTDILAVPEYLAGALAPDDAEAMQTLGE